MTEIDGVRELPKNIEAEQAVLGSLILEPDGSWREISSTLAADMFYQQRHRTIFKTIAELQEKEEPSDVVSLANRLEEREEMERAGGRMYLNELVDRVVTTASLEYYAKIVRRKAQLRFLIEAGGRITELGYDEVSDLDEVMDQAESALLSISRCQSGGIKTLSEIGPRALEHMTAVIARGFDGLPTGLAGLDGYLNGLTPGLYVLAGRPSMGKTTLALDIAYRQAGMPHPEHAERNIKPGLISIEMDELGLYERLISRELGYFWKKRIAQTDKDEQLREINNAAAKVDSQGIMIDERPHDSIQGVAGAIYEMLLKHKTDIIFIDYIQLLGHSRRHDNREQEVAAVMRKLVRLQKEAQIPIVVLAQLNRECERSSDKRPMLSHLRESGAIEQDADVVMFTYNPAAYGFEGAHEIIITKNRQGAPGTAYLHWNKGAFTFSDSTLRPKVRGEQREKLAPVPQG